jgi:FkbM family methyltransferase
MRSTKADGERELHIAYDSQGQELDFFHSLERLEGASQFRHSRSMRVECRSLESLVAEGVLPAAVGILKTDTEGHDVGVLRGLGAMRPRSFFASISPKASIPVGAGPVHSSP